MQTSRTCFGAIRLNFTTKKGNKDYYKGTRQAFVPGTSVRTGLPGRHLGQGNGRPRFEIEDTKVRHYVAPPKELYYDPDSTLKPYLSQKLDADDYKDKLRNELGSLPPFSPISVPRSKALAQIAADTGKNYESIKNRFKSDHPRAWKRMGSRRASAIDFAKQYRALPAHEKEALKQQARREWWAAYQERIPKVKEVFERASDVEVASAEQ